uniref:NET domain-containing protein n=1 Tax=Caenorhabditis tropicalis TaxID=1561998 RepID=A0A1I7UZK5_9PELO
MPASEYDVDVNRRGVKGSDDHWDAIPSEHVMDRDFFLRLGKTDHTYFRIIAFLRRTRKSDDFDNDRSARGINILTQYTNKASLESSGCRPDQPDLQLDLQLDLKSTPGKSGCPRRSRNPRNPEKRSTRRSFGVHVPDKRKEDSKSATQGRSAKREALKAICQVLEYERSTPIDTPRTRAKKEMQSMLDSLKDANPRFYGFLEQIPGRTEFPGASPDETRMLREILIVVTQMILDGLLCGIDLFFIFYLFFS